MFIFRIVEDAARNRLFQDGRDAFDLVSLNIQVNLLIVCSLQLKSIILKRNMDDLFD